MVIPLEPPSTTVVNVVEGPLEPPFTTVVSVVERAGLFTAVFGL